MGEYRSPVQEVRRGWTLQWRNLSWIIVFLPVVALAVWLLPIHLSHQIAFSSFGIEGTVVVSDCNPGPCYGDFTSADGSVVLEHIRLHPDPVSYVDGPLAAAVTDASASHAHIDNAAEAELVNDAPPSSPIWGFAFAMAFGVIVVGSILLTVAVKATGGIEPVFDPAPEPIRDPVALPETAREQQY